MKSIPPSAAVENIGQLTSVRTSISRKMKDLLIKIVKTKIVVKFVRKPKKWYCVC